MFSCTNKARHKQTNAHRNEIKTAAQQPTHPPQKAEPPPPRGVSALLPKSGENQTNPPPPHPQDPPSPVSYKPATKQSPGQEPPNQRRNIPGFNGGGRQGRGLCPRHNGGGGGRGLEGEGGHLLRVRLHRGPTLTQTLNLALGRLR